MYVTVDGAAARPRLHDPDAASSRCRRWCSSSTGCTRCGAAPSASTAPMLFALGVLFVFGARRPDRPLPRRHPAGRLPARHLLRRRPLPPHHGGGGVPRLVRGDLLLVPQDVRPHDVAPLGTLHFWLTLPTLVVIFGGMLFIGNAGMQRRLYDPSAYETFSRCTRWNVRITHTAYAARSSGSWSSSTTSSRRCCAATRRRDNPWQVGTLEWTHASSPPAAHNFDEIPTVRTGRTSSTIRSCRRRQGLARAGGAAAGRARVSGAAGARSDERARAHLVHRHGRVPRRAGR